MSDQLKKFATPLLFTGDGRILKNAVITTDSFGNIQTIDENVSTIEGDVQKIDGAITPGHINTHCHLELSHMKGKVDTGTQLLPFLKAVVSYRNIDQEQIYQAIEAADAEMYENGIVAVGDISNKADTAPAKKESKIRYYTFVEMFDFLQDGLATKTFDQYMEVYEAHSGFKSVAPHAPYTVSRSLFEKINGVNHPGSTVSIHNQETPHENALFLNGTGGFMEFFTGFGFDMSAFQPTGKTAIHYALENMRHDTRILMVHNTTSITEDIDAAHRLNKDVFWASCPNANLYIENRLPDYTQFLSAGAKMTLGTDSLTSNWQLSIAEEMFTVAKYCSYVSVSDLVIWATSNGARALGFNDLGVIAVGKKPGLVQMNISEIGGQLKIISGNSKRII